MEDQGLLADELFGQIDWDSLLADIGDWLNVEAPALSDSSPVEAFSNPSPDSVTPGITSIESLLMNDDDQEDKLPLDWGQQLYNEFLTDILSDSPPDGSGSGEVLVDALADKESDAGDESGNSSPEEEKVDGAEVKKGGDDPDDPISKKRRRQLRNRDAAMRSRERKKIYMKDLEMKSKYLEGECRKLGWWLQLIIAENQALRLSLQKGSALGASTAMQESAVLLLESLLLGSLLWLLGIRCLFTLPKLPHSVLEAIPQENVGRKGPGTVAPRGAGNEMSISLRGESFVKTKRCKASRTRMKMSCHALKSFGVRLCFL